MAQMNHQISVSIAIKTPQAFVLRSYAPSQLFSAPKIINFTQLMMNVVVFFL